jgi:hypothetical protein
LFVRDNDLEEIMGWVESGATYSFSLVVVVLSTLGIAMGFVRRVF